MVVSLLRQATLLVSGTVTFQRRIAVVICVDRNGGATLVCVPSPDSERWKTGEERETSVMRDGPFRLTIETARLPKRAAGTIEHSAADRLVHDAACNGERRVFWARNLLSDSNIPR